MSDKNDKKVANSADEVVEQNTFENEFGPTTAQALPSTTPTTGSGPALRIHGFSQPGQHTGAGLNYYTIFTTVDITPTGIPQMVIPRGYPLGVYTDTISNSQYMFDKLVETISLRAQPVVMSKVTQQTAAQFTAVNTLPDFAPGTGNVWTLSFIIEHNGAWDTKQIGWMAEGHPPIKGGSTPWDTNPDLGQTIAENLQFMSPAFANTGAAGSTTNTFTVVAQGPFTA